MQGVNISQEEFRQHFDPNHFEHKTYLLCEIKRDEDSTSTKYCYINQDSDHAEIKFLKDDIFAKEKPCSVTWYLSWSPCSDCSTEIVECLKKCPDVSLTIYAARLYFHDKEKNREGLRTLKQSGVNIQVMKKSDYEYCWETFVRDKEGKYDFPTDEVWWSEELERIWQELSPAARRINGLSQDSS